MSKRRRRSRRAAIRGTAPKISVPPPEGLRRHDTIPADYAHIIADLRLIALLATTMIGGLVILSYFIRQ